MLKNGKWSKKYDKCIICKTIDKKYQGNGMCRKCYQNKLRKTKKGKEGLNKYTKSEKHKKCKKRYYKKNCEKYKEIARLNREKNRKENPEIFREYIKKNHFNRWHNDPRYRLKCNISTQVFIRVKSRLSSKKGKSTFSFLPYTIDDLIQHLENQFKPGMSWANYGKWHIDHIRPDCKFNYKNVEDEEFQKCWALENLQPLWAEENLRKSGN